MFTSIKIVKPKIYFILLVCFFLFINAQAQNGNIEINLKNNIENLSPGKSYTLFFEITNSSNNDLSLNSTLVVPEHFNLILSGKKISLKAHSKKNVILAFSVSKYCQSNVYDLTFNISQDHQIVAFKKLKFSVIKRHNLNVEVFSAPDYLRLEKDFFCEYLVTNNGNNTEKINFESRSAFKIDPNSSILNPDSSLVVKVYQKVPITLYNKTTILNSLKVKLNGSDTIFSNRVAITVYPNVDKKPDLYERFPISVTGVFNSVKGLDTINVFKYRVEGSGFINRAHTQFLSFNYSGPNQPQIVRFGEYERYSILYKTPKLEAVIGDVNFSLSNITETSRYGKGSVLNYKFKNIETSIFYIKPQFTNQISDSYGGKILYNLSDKTFLQLGFINRSLFENDERFNSQIYNLVSSYEGNRFNINGELAYEKNNKTSGLAMSLESSLSIKKIDFRNTIQYSDKNYKGYIRNSKLLLSVLNYRLTKKLNAVISANYSSINPVKDSINYDSSPILSKYHTSINYIFNKQNKLVLGAYVRKKEDRFYPKKYNFEEKLLSLSFSNKKMGYYSLNFYNRYGSTINYLSSDTSAKNVFFSSIDFSLNFINNLSLGLNGSYQQTNKQSDTNNLIKSFYYGGFLQYDFKTNLDLNLFYRNNYDLDEFSSSQSFIEARLNYNYKQKHLISLSASQSSFSSDPLQKELFIWASYSFNINVPTFKDKSVGLLHGKIISNYNENLEGILLLLDNKIAITNKKGIFNFYNLTPKAYFLSVLQSSLPKGKIIIENLPYMVDVKPNKELQIVLNLGKTGNVFGSVKIKKSTKIQSAVFIKKFPRVVVKIYKDNLSYLTKIDSNGNFEFKELSPGDWIVELLVKNLTKDFTFDKIKDTITVVSDKTRMVLFKVKNYNRVIKKSKKKFKL